MIIFRTIITILLAFLAMQSALAQAGFQLRQFGTEDGLPSNGIKGLQWDDKTGFLWIGTEAGIVRYNGTDFKLFDTEDDNAGNSRIMFLVKNNAGVIYSRDEAGLVFTIDRYKVKLREKTTRDALTTDNSILLNVSDQLYRHQFDSGQQRQYIFGTKILPIRDTACLLIHRGALYFFSVSLPSPVAMPEHGFINGMVIGQNYLLVDSSKQVSVYDLDTRKLTPVTISFNTHTSLSPEESHFFWENGMPSPILTNRNRAWLLDYRQGKLIAEPICDTIPPHMLIRFVQFDKATHTLFLGTDSRGITVISKNNIESVKAANTHIGERVSYYSQVELPNGNVLTSEGHIAGKVAAAKISPPFTGRIGNYTYLDDDSTFWYAQVSKQKVFTYLHRYDFKTGNTKVYSKFRFDLSTAFVRLSDTRMYFANNRGIAVMDNDSLKYLYQHTPRASIVYDLKEIDPGVLGIATCNGILRFDTRSRKLDTLFLSGDACTRTIRKYKNYLFIGTYGKGIFVTRNGNTRPLPLDKNKYLLFTHCFALDEYGFCWLSTNRGLFKASLEAMINAYEGSDPWIYYHYYGKRDGMSMTEMNGGCTPCAITLADKTISFPTMDGLVWVNPQTTRPVLPKREIFIDRIRVNTKFLPDSVAYLELPASTSEIEIHLAYAGWGNRENNYVYYQLDNEAWQRTDEDKETMLRFVNLSPGDHLLRIRKISGFDQDNHSYKELKFSIATPWYRKWWFYGLATALGFGLLWLLMRLRTNRYRVNQQKLEKKVAEKTIELKEQNAILEKNDTIKTRLISIISHDIITPLKFLAVAGRNLVEKRNLMSDELQDETIREMTTTSQELQLLSTNILNWIKYQSENKRLTSELFNLGEMVNQILQVLGLPAHQKQLQMVNQVDANLVVYQYFEPLKIMLYNVVSNAINFSEKGIIRIESELKGDEVVLSVTDEGVGMSQEQVQHILNDAFIIPAASTSARKGNGLGYLIIKDLVKLAGASISIDSQPGKGTTVSILFPARKDLPTS